MTDAVQERIEREVNEHEVVLFMKGTPVFPQCGFSAVMVRVLSHLGVKFKGIDVRSGTAPGYQSIRRLADSATAICERRVHRRLRYRPRDVRNRRARSIPGCTRREDRRRFDLTVA